MHIGEVAQPSTELSLRSLAHWTSGAASTPQVDTDGGFRLYTEADVEKILSSAAWSPSGSPSSR